MKTENIEYAISKMPKDSPGFVGYERIKKGALDELTELKRLAEIGEKHRKEQMRGFYDEQTPEERTASALETIAEILKKEPTK